MKKKFYWKCSNCGDITHEEKSDDNYKDSMGNSIPRFGWGCWKCFKGQRYLIKKPNKT